MGREKRSTREEEERIFTDRFGNKQDAFSPCDATPEERKMAGYVFFKREYTTRNPDYSKKLHLYTKLRKTFLTLTGWLEGVNEGRLGDLFEYCVIFDDEVHLDIIKNFTDENKPTGKLVHLARNIVNDVRKFNINSLVNPTSINYILEVLASDGWLSGLHSEFKHGWRIGIGSIGCQFNTTNRKLTVTFNVDDNMHAVTTRISQLAQYFKDGNRDPLPPGLFTMEDCPVPKTAVFGHEAGYSPDGDKARAIGLWLWERAKELGDGRGAAAQAIRDLCKTNILEKLGKEKTEDSDLRHYLLRTKECINAAEVLSIS